jgi:FkbM family methyltransferase
MPTAFLYRHLPRVMYLLNRIAGVNYEREMELLDLLCDPARMSVDVGAKAGMYTYRILARSAGVVAFEPIPMFNEALTAVFRDKRARVEPVALSNESGKAVLRLPFGHFGVRRFGRSTIDKANALNHHQIARVEELEVEVRRLDDYDLADVGFIKIDVEGHEVPVLEGADATISRHRPNMLVECNDEHHPGGSTRFAAWLRAHGYAGLFIDGRALREIELYDPAEHWAKHGIENFICLHRSRTELLGRLTTRVSERTLRVPSDTLASRPAASGGSRSA